MPKGRHKGARRQFTDFDAEQAKAEREAKEASWRAKRGELPSDDSDKEKESDEDTESETESSSEEEEEEDAKVRKSKGVSGLIELENPNRVKKANVKVSSMTDEATPAKPELSRREREELQKQRATAHYRKLHAQGKTEEARADLERLAIIRAKREEAEQKKREQLQAKEDAKAAQAAKKGGKS